MRERCACGAEWEISSDVLRFGGADWEADRKEWRETHACTVPRVAPERITVQERGRPDYSAFVYPVSQTYGPGEWVIGGATG